MQVRRKLCAHVVFEHANINSDACIAELLHATSRNLRVWINCSDNDARDACINNCLRAWASAPSVAAWFKCAEQSCACCIFPAALNATISACELPGSSVAPVNTSPPNETTTAPTQGFGRERRRASLAVVIANCMCCSSSVFTCVALVLSRRANDVQGRAKTTKATPTWASAPQEAVRAHASATLAFLLPSGL